MGRVRRQVDKPILGRMQAGNPARAHIPPNVAPFAFGPDESRGLHCKCAAQKRHADILPLALPFAMKECCNDAIGDH